MRGIPPIVFLLSLGAHMCTFLPSVHISMRQVWPLHIAALIAFGIMIVRIARVRPKPDRYSGEGYLEWARRERAANVTLVKAVIAELPTSARIFAVVVFLYAIFNFMSFFVLLEGGGPGIRDGQYVLYNHGKIIRVLTEEEYRRFEAYEVRGFSGHWMLFSVIPSIFFWRGERALRRGVL